MYHRYAVPTEARVVLEPLNLELEGVVSHHAGD